MYSKDFFNFIKPFFIENWPDNLIELSTSQVSLKLENDERDKLIEQVDEHKHKFIDGFFPKVCDRSAKDANLSSFKCCDGKQVYENLFFSKRIRQIITLCKENEYTPYLHLREFFDIRDDEEFRILVLNKKLVGISSLYIPKNLEEEKKLINKLFSILFLADNIIRCSHIDSFVSDILVKQVKILNSISSNCILLDLNPFVETTSIPFFSWIKKDFDSTFRFEFENEVKKIKIT